MAKSIEGSPYTRFEGEIALIAHIRSGIVTFSRPTTESNDTLEVELDREANVNPSFREAWNASGNCRNLPDIVQKYETTLKRSEIKLIMAYTYEGEPGNPKFYKELNEDFRNNDLMGGRFPNAKRILRNALIELMEFQKENGKKLPVVLYRWEPSFLAQQYQEQKDKSMHLNMFTSTSVEMSGDMRSKENDMLTKFIEPETGAFIEDFSFYDETEVLLPPLHGKIKVNEASKTGSKLQGPIL
ncbi:hypothetical protein SNE40_012446 [Patella caerulea]|uniref:NAD(P)(+)--arginine ADP-ribosyltransferase n=1 Tax=Patella caerulea TaxID=87958 RepID=A0AAN8JSF1_PATCE